MRRQTKRGREDTEGQVSQKKFTVLEIPRECLRALGKCLIPNEVLGWRNVLDRAQDGLLARFAADERSGQGGCGSLIEVKICPNSELSKILKCRCPRQRSNLCGFVLVSIHMRTLRTLPLTTKLILLLIMPLSGLIWFGAFGAWEKWRVERDYKVLNGNAAVLQQIGRLVHELQKERGRSAGFINSKGATFVQELPLQHRSSDGELVRLRDLLRTFNAASFGPDFAARLKTACESLEPLAARRQSVLSCSISAAESTAYYSSTIAAQLDVVVAMSHLSKDAEMGDGISCYVNFLQAKEHAGIERALLTSVFALDRFSGDTFMRFAKVLAAQETFLRVFESFASAEQKKYYAEVVRGPQLETVAKLRQLAFDHASEGRFGVAAKVWFDAMTAKIDLMKLVEDRLAVDYTVKARRIEASAARAFRLFSEMTLAIVVGTALLGYVVIRSISQSIQGVSEDLTTSSEQTLEAASQVSAASQSIADGASSQAASLEETSASLEEITSMIRLNADHAGKAGQLALQASQAADTGEAEMGAMSAAVEAIQTSSKDVAKIIRTIEEVAFQTNILALNAAVEAARAGEAGTGFAVVADEVRNLAHRSATAAKETAEKIENAIRRTSQGAEISGRVASAFHTVTAKVRELNELVAQVATASKEQCQGVSQVNTAVAQVDRVTQANAAASEECASAATQLSAQAQTQQQRVRDLIALFGGGDRQNLAAGKSRIPQADLFGAVGATTRHSVMPSASSARVAG